MCEDCRENVGSEIYDRVEEFCRTWPDAEYGPAHIVLSDFNCEPVHIRWCLGLLVGELQRRGMKIEPRCPEEAKGVHDLASGALGGDPLFYRECDTECLIETEQFLRDWLLPRCVIRFTPPPAGTESASGNPV